jgi:hypothetical protein
MSFRMYSVKVKKNEAIPVTAVEAHRVVRGRGFHIS